MALHRQIASVVAPLVAYSFLLTATPRSAWCAEAAPALAPASETPGAIAPSPAPTSALPLAGPAMAEPGNPALDFHTPAPEQPSIFHRWWFWTAVGAAAAATVVIIVVSSRGHAPPSTDLGNQEFQP